jgi:hypothetical protein
MWSAIRAPSEPSAVSRGAASRVLAAALWLASAGSTLAAQGAPAAAAGMPDYARIYGRDYAAALEFAKHHPAADDVFRAWEIPPDFTWAIVFPELIRYSALADIIESANLKVLYVQFGHGYGNFSVGHFQMKPSFAETLEGDFRRLADARDRARLTEAPFDRADTVEARRARSRRLTDVVGQAVYLAMFVKVLDKIYAGETWDGLEAKLRFYATAYNAGYRLGAARLRKEMAVPRFHTGLFAGKVVYPYADVAARFWRAATEKEGNR